MLIVLSLLLFILYLIWVKIMDRGRWGEGGDTFVYVLMKKQNANKNIN